MSERGCVDDEELAGLVERRLSEVAARAIATHAESCPPCQTLVAAALADDADAARTVDESAATPGAEGHEPARYTLGETLGEGAMGRVVLAHDTRLDRKVALKVLREERGGSVAMEARLGREARAMAKLLHPNVVAVFDAGRLPDGRLFVAMEYVEGETLRRHLARHPQSRREILRMYTDAARGLLAAHELGLVHRDFKPDNVLVSRGASAKVSDFGLVRQGRAPEPNESDAAPESLGLTTDGAVLGTPSYMAPEQHDGKEADARADQFAFMVSLYEALAGKKPYTGKTLEELRGAMAEAPPPPVTDDPALAALVLRGLAVDPERRFPSMRPVLAELERLSAAPSGAARLPLLVGAALLAVVGLGGLAAQRTPERPEAAPAPLVSPAEPRFEPASLTRLEAPETARKLAAAFETAGAPAGTKEAAVALLFGAARAIDAAAKTNGSSLGARECLAILDDDVSLLVDEMERIHDLTAAEGAVLAARELERPTVCTGASPDPAEAGRDKTDHRALAQVRMRRPLAVSPVLPGRFDAPTKRGLFALTTVLGVLSRDANAFPEDGDFHAIDEMLDSVMNQVEDESLAKTRGNELVGQLTNKGLALALDAGKADRATEVARALSFTEVLSMDALRARLTLLAATRDPSLEARGRRLDEVAPLVKRVEDPHTSTAYAVARMKLDAERGLRPARGSGLTCAKAPPEQQAACVPVLEAAGDLSLERDEAEVVAEVATTRAVYGPNHPRAAFARVHEAEWRLARGDTERAAASAREAVAALEASLTHDVNVELAQARAFVPGGDRARLAPLEAWSPPHHVGDEAYAKYVHLARAHAVLVRALPEAGARSAAKSGRALRGRDDADATLLPVELAATARFSEDTKGYDLERAALRLGHPVFLARARARLAALEKDPSQRAARYTAALVGAAHLPPGERATLRVAAANATTDRALARALLEKALSEASEGDRPAIQARLSAL